MCRKYPAGEKRLALTALVDVIYRVGPMLLNSIGNLMWGQMNSFVLTAISLNILIGEIVANAQFVERMYRSLSDWVQWLPVKLLHSNIASSTMFSAILGSSIATAATNSTVAFPRFREHAAHVDYSSRSPQTLFHLDKRQTDRLINLTALNTASWRCHGLDIVSPLRSASTSISPFSICVET